MVAAEPALARRYEVLASMPGVGPPTTSNGHAPRARSESVAGFISESLADIARNQQLRAVTALVSGFLTFTRRRAPPGPRPA